MIELSVIVPSYNSDFRLSLLLTTLERQTLEARRFEVIVIDDGSSDDTTAVLDAFRDRMSLVSIRLAENAGRSAARNRGIEAARGRYLLFYDAHMIGPPETLERHLRVQKEHDKLAACGVSLGHSHRIFSVLEHDFPTRVTVRALRFIERSARFGSRLQDIRARLRKHGRAEILHADDLDDWDGLGDLGEDVAILPDMLGIYRRFGNDLQGCPVPWLQFITQNVSVPRDLVVEAGMYDEWFQGWGLEDYELGLRLHKMGVQFGYFPELKVYHQYHPENSVKNERARLRNLVYMAKKHPGIEMLLYRKKEERYWGFDNYCTVIETFRRLRESGDEKTQIVLDAFEDLATREFQDAEKP